MTDNKPEPTVYKDKSGKEHFSYPKPDDFEPVPHYEEGHKWGGNYRCQAWSRSAGRQCNMPAVHRGDTCRYHGGKTPIGIARDTVISNSAKQRTSKYLKGVRLEDYLDAYESKDLLSLKDAIAQCEMEIADSNRKMDHNESAKGWFAIRDTIPLMRKAVNAGDAVEFARLLTHLEGIVAGNIGGAMAKQEKADWLHLRGGLSTKERQLRLDAKKVVQKEQVMVWIGAILSAMKTSLELHIEEKKIRVDVLTKTQEVAVQNLGQYILTDNLIDG